MFALDGFGVAGVGGGKIEFSGLDTFLALFLPKGSTRAAGLDKFLGDDFANAAIDGFAEDEGTGSSGKSNVDRSISSSGEKISFTLDANISPTEEASASESGVVDIFLFLLEDIDCLSDF